MEKEYEEFHAHYQNFMSSLPRQLMWKLIRQGYGSHHAMIASQLLERRLEELEIEIGNALAIPMPEKEP